MAPLCLAAGEDSQPSARRAIEEILVTARRREESLQRVPVAVTALTGDFLVEHSIERAEDIEYYVPSLNIEEASGRKGVVNFSIRGQVAAREILAQDPAVVAYIGDVAQTRSQGIAQTLYDMESVQVLKGPQGTLFGRNTTGGAILFTPNKPTDEFGGYARVLAGDDSAFGLEGAVNLPISDSVKLRIAGATKDRDGYVTDVTTGDDLMDQNNESWRVGLLLQLTDNLENYTLYDHYQADEFMSNGFLSAARPTGFATLVFPETQAALARQQELGFYAHPTDIRDTHGDPVSKVENWGIGNTTTLQLGDVTVKNIFGYRSIDDENIQEADGTDLPLLHSASFTFADQISDELQVLGTALDDRVDWIVGGFYFKEDGPDGSDPNFLFLGRLPVNPFFSGGDFINKSYSVFGHATYAFEGAPITIGAGLRYTWDDRTMTLRSTQAGQCRLTDENGLPLPLDQCERRVNEDFSEPTWTATVDYQASESVLLYFAHRRGYRSGGFNREANSVDQFLPFDPETVTDFELGLKADWQLGDTTVRTNVAIYYQDYEDIQRIVPFISDSGNIVASIVNAAEGRVSGGEFELSAQLTEWLEISGFYSLTDTKYKSFETSVSGDLSDNEFPAVPKHTGSVRARAYLPLPSNAGEAFIQAVWYAQSDTFIGEVTSVEGTIDSYDIVNLRAQWNNVLDSPVDAAFFVNNATDEEIVQGLFHLQESLGYTLTVAAPPRLWGFELTYRFGNG